MENGVEKCPEQKFVCGSVKSRPVMMAIRKEAAERTAGRQRKHKDNAKDGCADCLFLPICIMQVPLTPSFMRWVLLIWLMQHNTCPQKCKFTLLFDFLEHLPC